ncbi:hypothetical protein [Mycobacterium sp. D16R24]|uniref:hypothetical protein n=1 Tax=Mycobacterium sp. D16R24 TaxID=1855656 RepID=UPI001117AA22|nr:hypothetical protein [Mycobacterium sp. D16R24]
MMLPALSSLRIGVAAALTAAALVVTAATCEADPGPDVPEQPIAPVRPPGLPEPPPPSQIGNPLAMAGTEQGPGGVPTNLGIAGDPSLLGQNTVPAAPGGAGPVTVPGANALNNQYLLPQNLMPAEPGKGEIYGVAPGEENADVAGGDYLRRLWHQHQDGQLGGGLLGRRPKEELNQPLPGTAPLPGTRIPGLGDDAQGPAPEQWHWTPPEQPENAPVVPPPAPVAGHA